MEMVGWSALSTFVQTWLQKAKTVPWYVWGIGTLIGYALYYRIVVVKRPKIFRYKELEGSIINRIFARMTTIQEPYYPTFFLPNTHLQVIYSHLFGNYLPASHFQRELLSLSDGGTVSLDWYYGPASVSDATLKKRKEEQSAKPILMLCHGMTGGSHDALIGRMCPEAAKHFDVVVFNRRGQAGVELTTPFLPHFSDPRDIKEVLAHIVACHPGRPIGSACFSAGTGTVGNYLIEVSSDTPLFACAMISPGYNLEKMVLEYMPKHYNALLTRNLRGMIKRHEKALSNSSEMRLSASSSSSLPLPPPSSSSSSKSLSKKDSGALANPSEKESQDLYDKSRSSSNEVRISEIDYDAAANAESVEHFDEVVYASVYGFEGDVRKFYQAFDPVPRVHKVTIPLLCISSLDDPVCHKDNIPYRMFASHAATGLVLSERGSHCTFLEGPLGRQSWANRVALDFLLCALHELQISPSSSSSSSST